MGKRFLKYLEKKHLDIETMMDENIESMETVSMGLATVMCMVVTSKNSWHASYFMTK